MKNPPVCTTHTPPCRVLPSLPGEVLGEGFPDWPPSTRDFIGRQAYQRGVADARWLAIQNLAEYLHPGYAGGMPEEFIAEARQIVLGQA